MKKNLKNGFALVEVVIVIVLVSGSFLVFLEALSQAKNMRVKSEIVTIQSMLLSSKINQLRSNGFENIPQTHDFVSFADYPNYTYSLTCSYVNNQLITSSENTNYKLIELKIKHSDARYPIISDFFIMTNAF
jgi:type II secretory pathway pseudopilin PulG